MPALSSAFGFLRTAELLYSGKTACYGGDPATMLRMIDLFGIETIIASPHQLLAILDRKDREPSCETQSLREVIIGGGYVSPKLFARIQAGLCRQVVYNYASTETGLIALGRYDNIKHAPHAVGFPVPDAAVEIVDDENIPVPAGTEGRVRCRTNYFLSAYLDRHPQQSDIIENIWWMTGDLGRFTEDGILCIHGRADDVINLGGVKISGAMLDEMIQGVPGVEDAGGCAVPGDAGIMELWVAVVPQPGVSIATIREHILRIPQLQQQHIEIFVVHAVPRTDLGKIARGKMREGLLKVRQPPP
jgi:acyl-coenzyme A synthetase/AMP-(fatty) acid ligase